MLIRHPAAMSFTELLGIIIASVSCITFCLVAMILLLVFCRKDPLCCKQRLSSTTNTTEVQPPFYSRPSVFGIAPSEHTTPSNPAAAGHQLPGGLFIVGRPDEYQQDRCLPQLPSYDSLCRTDRQRHTYGTIAQRFSLNRSHEELPPAYEETFGGYFPTADVQHLDVRLSIHALQQPWMTSRGASPRPPLSL